MFLKVLIVLQISRQSIKARTSYSNLKKCCEKKKERKNTKKIRQILKAHILGMAWQIQHKFGIGGSHPRQFAQKQFVCFCSESVEATDA